MQSVEMIPFGLLAGFVDDKEVRITEISTESFCFRVREQVERPRHIRIGFYDLSESMYREVELESYHFMEKKAGAVVYKLYRRGVPARLCTGSTETFPGIHRIYPGTDRRNGRRDGTDHLQLSCESGRDPWQRAWKSRNPFWFSGAQIRPVVRGMELALALDRRTWYNLYERNTIEKFTELYWKENGIGGWETA